MFPEPQAAAQTLRDRLKPPAATTNKEWCNAVTLAQSCLAKNSVRAYQGALSRFSALPWETPGQALLEVAKLRGKPPGQVDLAMAAARKWHQARAIPISNFDHPMVDNMISAVKREGRNPEKGAIFLKKRDIHGILRHFIADGSLAARRNATLLIMQYWGDRRFGDVRYLTKKDIRAGPEGSLLCTTWSGKTDQQHKGISFAIPARSSSGLHMVDIIREYTAHLPHGSSLLFPSGRGRNKFDYQNPISLKAWNEALRKAQHAIGIPPPHGTSHSIRKTATRVLGQAGVQEETVFHIGGWRSDAHRVYTAPSTEDKLHAVAKL